MNLLRNDLGVEDGIRSMNGMKENINKGGVVRNENGKMVVRGYVWVRIRI